MLVRKVIESQLRVAAATTGVVLHKLRPDGRGYRFTLKPAPGTPTRRRSASVFHPDRKVHAACWHQYGRFMRAVFTAAPDAVILAGTTRYNGVGDFNAIADSTGDRNVGNAYYPIAYRDACTCEQDDCDAANDWVCVG